MIRFLFVKPYRGDDLHFGVQALLQGDGISKEGRLDLENLPCEPALKRFPVDVISPPHALPNRASVTLEGRTLVVTFPEAPTSEPLLAFGVLFTYEEKPKIEKPPEEGTVTTL